MPLDEKTLFAKPTYKAAFLYVLSLANVQYDKEIYEELGIDAGNWTRVKNGTVPLSFEQERRLEQFCGNDGLTKWRAYRAGKGVYDLQEAKDKRISELEAENSRLQSELDTLIKYGVIGKAK